MALFLQLNLATAPGPWRERLGDGLLQAFFCTDFDCIHGKEEGNPFTRTHLLQIVDPARQTGTSRPPPAGDSEACSVALRAPCAAPESCLFPVDMGFLLHQILPIYCPLNFRASPAEAANLPNGITGAAVEATPANTPGGKANSRMIGEAGEGTVSAATSRIRETGCLTSSKKGIEGDAGRLS